MVENDTLLALVTVAERDDTTEKLDHILNPDKGDDR
jgi:hypothetical protein